MKEKFAFQMDIKDASDANPEKIAAAGMRVVDDRRYNSNPVFTIDGFDPKTLDEALDRIMGVFYFYPLYVWIDGEKLDPTRVHNKRVSSF